jgi:tRNA-specific 2-thiouridylase
MVKDHVVIGLSGGVDSSVASAILVEQGYRVTGVMLRLWTDAGYENFNRCCTPDSIARARRVAAILGIPFYVYDVREKFHDTIVKPFIKEYLGGITPNPCIICNRDIRWGVLLNYARSMDAQYLATGHYARLITGENGLIRLLKGVDATKDQSYVLSRLNQSQLTHTLFPLGALLKNQVREMAEKYGLPTQNTADSQDLCFLAGRNYRQFILSQGESIHTSGEIVDTLGQHIGDHQGLYNYTIGQRKGLGDSRQEPYYVIRKDIKSNQLIIGPKTALSFMKLSLTDINWISSNPPANPFTAEVKIRYQSTSKPAIISMEDGGYTIDFKESIRDITPGQTAVIYNGDEVIGSGTITNYQ